MSDKMDVQWYRFLKDQPCQICGGIEGCDHTVSERRQALEDSLSSPPSKKEGE